MTISHLADEFLDRTVAPGYSSIGYAVRCRLPSWPADPPRIAAANVVVTGASSGIGAAAAAATVRLGATVHAAVRDPDKARRALIEAGLDEDTRDAKVVLHRCDLADLDEVEDLAGTIVRQGDPIAAIIHNAGAMPPQRRISPQDHELTMALHVLTPMLLTERLLPVLDHARIVLVTSGGMYAQRLRDDDPEFVDGSYSPTAAYARSKRAQVDLLPHLQDRWSAAGHVVAAMHPGWVDTPGVQESLPRFERLLRPVLRSAQQGADTAVWLAATQSPPAGGLLWHDRCPRPPTWFGLHTSPDAARDRLWAWALRHSRLTPEGTSQ